MYLPLLIPIIVISWIFYFAHSRAVLDKWANNNDYMLLYAKRSMSISPGPFKWRWRGQEAYQISVKSVYGGQERSGWIMVTNFWPFPPKFDVRWDMDYDNFETALQANV